MSSWAVPLLRLIRLSKRFGPVTAVRDVDLDIYDGDFVTILGPNGAGKTTLLRLIASLTRPTSGNCSFFLTLSVPIGIEWVTCLIKACFTMS